MSFSVNYKQDLSPGLRKIVDDWEESSRTKQNLMHSLSQKQGIKQIDRQKDRQTDKQEDRQTDKD